MWRVHVWVRFRERSHHCAGNPALNGIGHNRRNGGSIPCSIAASSVSAVATTPNRSPVWMGDRATTHPGSARSGRGRRKVRPNATRVITDTPGRSHGFAAGAVGAGRDAGTALGICSAGRIPTDRQRPATRVPEARDRGWGGNAANDECSSLAASLVRGIAVRNHQGQAWRKKSRIDTSGELIRGGGALIGEVRGGGRPAATA